MICFERRTAYMTEEFNNDGFFGGSSQIYNRKNMRQRIVTIFGLPDATHSIVNRKAEKGPRILRNVSKMICSNPNVEKGILDNLTGKLLCGSTYFRDIGDFQFPHHVSEMLELQSLFDEKLSESNLTIALLGDDAANYPLLVGWQGVLIHLDAHDDRSISYTTRLTHGNYLDKLLRHSPDLDLIQIGLREILDARRVNPCCSKVTTVRNLERLPEVLKSFRAQTDCWISFDVDVISPSIVDSIACPMPGGLLETDIQAIFKMVSTSSLKIRGTSLSEFSPRSWPATRKDTLDALTVVQMLIRGVDTILSYG